MTSMRWESCRASPQHQCLPWTAASAIYTHRQLLKLVQPAYRAPLQPLRDNTLQQLPSCNSRILQSALQQLQPTSNDTCKQISRHRSLTDRYGTVLGSVGTSHSNEAVQTTTPGGYQPSGSQGDNDDDDPFNANFGEAVLVLREDLPFVFQQDMRYHIFREDITFRTPSMAYLTGLWKYQLLHKGARLLGNLLYADVRVSLARMWQPAIDKKQLKVHWCVSGHPRLSLSVEDIPLSTEIISTYYFDSKGKIYEHQVDQIIPPDSLPVRFLEWLVGRLQPRAMPQPQLPIPGA